MLHLDSGPELVLHPENARRLFLSQTEEEAGSDRPLAGEAALPDEVRVPSDLAWRMLDNGMVGRGGARGFLGRVLLRALQVVRVLFSPQAAAGDFAASAIVKKFDGAVEEGLYRLNATRLETLKGADRAQFTEHDQGAICLVFIHGTFSSTVGTFARFWLDHPASVERIFHAFVDGPVLAFEHATLGVSPLRNALNLALALPERARLTLVTHSRGGLVAEALVRVCAAPDDPEAHVARYRYADPDDEELFSSALLQAEHDDLRRLCQVVREKQLQVLRVVRVACPARGTLLASTRLDAYLSVFRWTLQLAGLALPAFLVELLSEVARQRADPTKLPGLAAQMPLSPLVNWLHDLNEAVPGDLRVIAGDLEADSLVSWLKTLLADAYYWTDHDLVVQTSSMYGGAPRGGGASYFFDQGAEVSHFRYFANPETADAITEAVVQPSPRGFRTIGPLSWRGESSTGARAASVPPDDGTRPAVFVLPGILGSNLKKDGRRIWLSFRIVGGLENLAYQPHGADGIVEDGPMDGPYADLAQYLSSTHQVYAFGYDWRRPLEEEADRLAGQITAALERRARSGQPVRLVAHSMGGLLARALQLRQPQVWDRLMAIPGARLLMLGTPNAGSWAPMQVLTNDDQFGNLVSAVGLPFRDGEARQILAGFPGFLQLQAGLLDSNPPLRSAKTWQELSEKDAEIIRQRSLWHAIRWHVNSYRWGLPTQAVLDQAVALRQALDAQLATILPKFADRILLVVGKADSTPAGYDIDKVSGLAYRNVGDGDGRVPVESALLPGVRTWAIDCAHGDLADHAASFEAYAELLQRGTTLRISPRAVSRGVETSGPHFIGLRRPAHTARRPIPPSLEEDVLKPTAPARLPAGVGSPIPALALRVLHSDLRAVGEPLLLGHYRSWKVTGAEAAMDRLIEGAMSKSLRAGLYPEQVGSHQIFLNLVRNPEYPQRDPWPRAVIIAGLGEEGSLQSEALVRTVRDATIAWAQRLVEQPPTAVSFPLTATLLGSGGLGISPEQAARAIAEGVAEANERLTGIGWPVVQQLTLVELYLTRATFAWNALQLLAETEPARYRLAREIAVGQGGLGSPPEGYYRGSDIDFLSVESVQQSGGWLLRYKLDRRRARSEQFDQQTQLALLRTLIAEAARDPQAESQVGLTLFKLLFPPGLRTVVSGNAGTLIDLDPESARIPWELLDTISDPTRQAEEPWAIRTKLVRKLRLADFRPGVVDARLDDHVLIIGEPKVDPKLYPPLPGARREAAAVHEFLAGSLALGPDRVLLLNSGEAPNSGGSASEIMHAVNQRGRGWRIIHISGHGEPPSAAGLGGVVLSDGTFLGPAELRGLDPVPELVFVNCCHLGAIASVRRSATEAGPAASPVEFASGVAEELIRIGVRCVIAAGWEVDDAAACAFARAFYEALLSGARFIDAVGDARRAARHVGGGNTWGAYQCYGDPEWTFARPGDAQTPAAPPRRSDTEIYPSGTALREAIDTLRIRTDRFDPVALAHLRVDLLRLEARYGERWSRDGSIAAAFGLAFEAIDDEADAIRWFEHAAEAEDAAAALRAAECLAQLRSNAAWRRVSGDITPGKWKKASRPAALRALKDAHAELERALRGIQGLRATAETVARWSLEGAVCRRLAMVERLRKGSVPRARLTQATTAWARAAELALAKGDSYFAAAIQAAAGEFVLPPKPDSVRWGKAQLEALKEELSRVESDPQRNSLSTSLAAFELDLVLALAAGEHDPTLTARLRDLLRLRLPSIALRSALDLLLFLSLRALPASAGNLLTQLTALLRAADAGDAEA
ncbi:MAG: CHAT domain-containing protein [Verrucomicrobia bacterium]|nr:CHAT domain-containing protein [Verrucomicrobiota bacterium]